MGHSNRATIRRQVNFLRLQFLQEGELPFTKVLPRETIAPPLEAIEPSRNEGIYAPLVTLWLLPELVLSLDHSCRAAVARLIAHKVSRGQNACSAKMSVYCQAKQRLPDNFLSAVACLVGIALESKVDPKSLWNGRRV